MIRKSTDKDLRIIHAWLVEQDKNDVPGTFLCNWDLTEKKHKKGHLLIYFDEQIKEPIAYQWGDLINPGILEVRQEFRGRGIGRKLVRHRIVQARKRGQCILVIQCKPPSSIPFWKKMGFALFDSPRGKNYAFQILKKRHRLPREGNPVMVLVRYFPEDGKYNPKTTAYFEWLPKAVQTSDGIIHLAERIYIFSEYRADCRDPVVEVEVAGQRLFRDKAKYSEATKIGIQRCNNGFYLDKIIPILATPRPRG
jgi:GNAT superfamily N-acetyltransferase